MKKGTAWYFGEIPTGLASLIGTVFMLIVAAMIMFVVSINLDVNVTGNIMHAVPKADSTVLTFLDSTAEGYPMKDLLSYAAYKGGTTITVDGKSIDLKAQAESLMDQLTDRAYTLTLETGDFSEVLSTTGMVESVKNTKVVAVIQGGENSGTLTLVIAK
jgi:hypothetical protein